MELVVVRHGHAGSKTRWTGDDRRRPLSASGRTQARHVAEIVIPMGPERILTSPLVRCVETIRPTAEALDLPLEEDEDLGPAGGDPALARFRALTAQAQDAVDGAPSAKVVLCTHGEVLTDVLPELATTSHYALPHKPPGGKGSIWLLDFARARLVSARYIPARAPHQRRVSDDPERRPG